MTRTMLKPLGAKVTAKSMFAPFSRGYYVGRLQVEPHGGDDALMHQRQVERVNEQLYASGEGVERVDWPLIMKLWQRHFAVHGDANVPAHTLLVPEWMTDERATDPLPGMEEVLLAKPDILPRILEWSGGGSDFVAR